MPGMMAGGYVPGAAPIPNVNALQLNANVPVFRQTLGLRGAVAGFWVRGLMILRSQAVASATRIMCATFEGSGRGYRFMTTGTNGLLRFSAFYTGVVEITAPTRVLAPSDVDLLIDCVFVWDQPNGRLRAYYQGVESGTGTVTGLAYLLPTAAPLFSGLARDNATLYGNDMGLVAVEGGDGFIPTAAEIATAHADTVALVAAGSLPVVTGIPGKTTWSTSVPATWNPPVLLTDTVAAQNWTISVGTAAQYTLFQVPGIWAP